MVAGATHRTTKNSGPAIADGAALFGHGSEGFHDPVDDFVPLGACLSNRNGETKESKLPCAGNCLARMVLGRFPFSPLRMRPV
jgi:hypothetical protein